MPSTAPKAVPMVRLEANTNPSPISRNILRVSIEPPLLALVDRSPQPSHELAATDAFVRWPQEVVRKLRDRNLR